MMKKIKITEAYCIELGRIVDIEEAHTVSMERNGAEFDFLCSSEKCRQQRIPITGVNYHKPPSSQARAMHFRENPKYQHDESCEWALINQYAFYEGIHKGETTSEATLRKKLYTALKDEFLITDYETYNPDVGVQTDGKRSIEQPISVAPRTKTHQDNVLEAVKKRQRTHSFYKLVRHHYELSQKFKPKEFKQFPLTVKKKKTSWFDYFKPFTYVWDDERFEGIMFGYISKNIKHYGTGYLIYMGATLNDLSVSIYISPKSIQDYRQRRELIDVLDNIDRFLSINAYFIPDRIELTSSPSGKQAYQIIITDLHRLRLVGKAKK